MKRISIMCLGALLFFAACQNSGSSTVGSYEQEETSESTEKSEGHGAAKQNHEGGSHEQAKEEGESGTTDTSTEATDTTTVVHDSTTLKAGSNH